MYALSARLQNLERSVIINSCYNHKEVSFMAKTYSASMLKVLEGLDAAGYVYWFDGVPGTAPPALGNRG